MVVMLVNLIYHWFSGSVSICTNTLQQTNMQQPKCSSFDNNRHNNVARGAHRNFRRGVGQAPKNDPYMEKKVAKPPPQRQKKSERTPRSGEKRSKKAPTGRKSRLLYFFLGGGVEGASDYSRPLPLGGANLIRI